MKKPTNEPFRDLWSGAEIGRFYKPTKKRVSLRLDADVVAWLKAEGRGYQTRANWLLRHAMLHFNNESALASREKNASRVSKGKERKKKR